ncbi:hypothetical protein GCM10023258_10160 [Terrabacter aeriphilus]|uniref:Abnormal spindle-like microcephaly-associated protein ASH domain-containing protein n=1 Tax=Terrabacter aeriphilus TaxID=515662 RepID=A0ABP9J584_9MICO
MAVSLRKPSQWQPGTVYMYDVMWIVILIGIAVGYSVQPAWSWLPHWTFAFQNVMPLWVPWAGALGGVTISLVGVVTHTHDWKALEYGYWHLARPFLGAVCGSVAVLIVVLVLRSVDPTVNNQAGTPASIALLSVISFVVGYREETFRTLVKRVVDVILASDTNATVSVALVPATLDFGDSAVNQPKVLMLTVVNAGKDTVHLPANAAVPDPVTGTIVATNIETDLAPSATAEVTVTWTPASLGQDLSTPATTLVLRTDSRTLSCPLNGRAV